MSLTVSILAAFLHAAAAGEPAQDAAAPEAVLSLGPLPLWDPLFSDSSAKPGFVSELDPRTSFPSEGEEVAWVSGSRAAWRVVETTSGGIDLPARPARSVTWLFAYATTGAFGPLGVEAAGTGDLRVFLDGEEVAHRPSGADGAASATRAARRGFHRVAVRVERDAGRGGRISIGVRSDPEPSFSTDPRHALTDYDELRGMGGYSSLAVSPDGDLVAVRRRGAAGAGCLVLDASSGRVVATPGGDSATPVSFRADSGALLLRSGGDLLLYDRHARDVQVVLEDEPGLGAVRWSPDGELLAFVSTRGAEGSAASGAVTRDGATRRTELRQKLRDWPTKPHLHLLHVRSKARRRICAPGDYVQDAFEFLNDSRTLLYLRNVPIDERPWFQTEFHRLDLVTGEDRVVATVRMGFENRPGLFGFAVSPDGTKCAFVGPPSELGDSAAVEPNAFDPDLYVMDLQSGRWFQVTSELAAAVSSHVQFSSDSKRVFFLGHAGSRDRLFEAFLPDGGDRTVRFQQHDPGGEAIHDVAHVDARVVAAVTSDCHRLPELSIRTGSRESARLDPNPDLRKRLLFARPVSQSFLIEDGTAIEAWLYRPLRKLAGEERTPVVVYYYGGATPTKRGFNELHQFLVAHGYALLVINPRGAAGYGRAFADHHVADWGEKAGSDILRGVEFALRENPDLDPERVGCFGGSYGGFMTMYLLTRTERFKAAVSLYGISNLASYFGEGMWGYTYGDQAMARHYPWTHPRWYTEHSPVFLADRVTTPLLLLHGDADGNVPPGESEQMFTALRLLGRPVEIVRFENEDHGLRGTWENRVRHRTMILEWFDRHLRGQPDAWNARWR